ncbi:hypothetical protein BaRGS_00021438 [Batillaria attramentaria]|uniref:Uncharacterized protein n=1 Tax=Batillaria attramentaria TaxID=370345 RepID=A0ABD0KJL2_9CAEN
MTPGTIAQWVRDRRVRSAHYKTSPVCSAVQENFSNLSSCWFIIMPHDPSALTPAAITCTIRGIVGGLGGPATNTVVSAGSSRLQK